MDKVMKWLMTAIRIGLGVLFIYAGIQKFNPAPRPASDPNQPVPEHVIKIRSLIGGMKQTDYFWQMVGVAEITCGILLVSQYLALLGAVMLIPITLNIFLFHLFLQPDDIGELLLTGLYLLANLALIAWEFPRLKYVFLPVKSILK
jgi:uncharacterized membrane protein YphA (DoxX/SURF4 family)